MPAFSTPKGVTFVSSYSLTSMKGEDLIQYYLDEIGHHNLLTQKEEVELAQIIEDGKEAEEIVASKDFKKISAAKQRALKKRVRAGREARQRFINANLRLVVSIAKKYRSSGLPLLDLIQEGNLGLIHAVEKFDWRKGFKFSTYATWWIRQSLIRGISNSNELIRLPVHARETAKTLRRFRLELESAWNRRVSLHEAGVELGLSREQVEAIIGQGEVVASLSQGLQGDGQLELGDVLEDQAVSVLEQATQSLVEDEVERLLSVLSDTERDVIRYRFFDGDEVHSYMDTGRRFNLSRERIRQIEVRAIAKMRHPSADIEAYYLLFSE
jgi:RNA polymerase sigma factor (sigma-70 family)